MEAIEQALKDAGFEIRNTEDNGENVILTVEKDGKLLRFETYKGASQAAIAEMIQLAEYRISQTEV